MKQHISERQLKEVDLEKIHELVRGNLQRHPFKPNEVTIGKMIEILEQNGNTVEIVTLPKKWRVVCKLSVYVEQELCDALWQALKEIL